jgi:hypothetical protein
LNLNLNPEAELAKLIAFPTRIPIKIIAEFRGHLLFGKQFKNNFLKSPIRIPVRKSANFA